MSALPLDPLLPDIPFDGLPPEVLTITPVIDAPLVNTPAPTPPQLPGLLPAVPQTPSPTPPPPLEPVNPEPSMPQPSMPFGPPKHNA